MERINFNYSLKNIPVPSQKSYQLQLIDKLNALLNECAGKHTFSRMMLITPVTEWLKKHTGSSPNITLTNAKN